MKVRLRHAISGLGIAALFTALMLSDEPGNDGQSSLPLTPENEIRALIRGYSLRDDSPYKGKATDGRDPGIDAVALEAAILGAPTPTPTPNPTPNPTSTPAPGPCVEMAREAWPRTWTERDQLLTRRAATGWRLEVVTSNQAIFAKERLNCR